MASCYPPELRPLSTLPTESVNPTEMVYNHLTVTSRNTALLTHADREVRCHNSQSAMARTWRKRNLPAHFVVSSWGGSPYLWRESPGFCIFFPGYQAEFCSGIPDSVSTDFSLLSIAVQNLKACDMQSFCKICVTSSSILRQSTPRKRIDTRCPVWYTDKGMNALS